MWSKIKNRICFLNIGFICSCFLVLIFLCHYKTSVAVADDRGIGLVETTPKVERVSMGNFWAVLIGIDQYDHWPRLSTAVLDTKDIKEVLEQKYGFTPERVKWITNREATREGILEALEWLLNEAGENDNVLIYYAGHGELDKVTGYWVPVEARLDKKGAYIGNSTIRDYIGAMKANHVYLVADSCFSGSLFAGLNRSKPDVITGRYFQEVHKRMSRQGLTSGGTEPVNDAGYDGHSIFNYYFLKSLRENDDPYLTASSLFDRLAAGVGNNSRQTPISQPLRDVRDEGGEFIFALSRIGRIESLNPPVGGTDGPVGITPNFPPPTPSGTPRRVIVLMSEKDRGISKDDSFAANALSEKLSDRGMTVISHATVGKTRLNQIRQAIEEGEGISSIKEDLEPMADTFVWGEIEATRGNTALEGLVSCIADATVQVVSIHSGEIVVQRNINDVRGFGANENKACEKALQKMGKEVGVEITNRM